MRFLLCLIIVLLACSCHTPEKHERTTTLVLKDNRGVIKMNLPPSWDTALQWTDYSDCRLCGQIKYRFQRKAFPIALESGWVYLGFPSDSIDQLTLVQSVEKQVTKDTLADIRQFRENMRKAFLIDDRHAHFVIDTILQAGKHLIPVLGISNDMDHMQSCEINAFAILKRDGVIFEFKFLAKNRKKEREDFVEKVMEVIRSIALEE